MTVVPAVPRLLPAGLGTPVLGPAGLGAPVLARRTRSRPGRAWTWPGRARSVALELPLAVGRLMPDLRGLPRLHAPGAGRLSGRDDAKRVQPLIGLGVAAATRSLQVVSPRVMPVSLPGARLVCGRARVPWFALARLAPILASCGHG